MPRSGVITLGQVCICTTATLNDTLSHSSASNSRNTLLAKLASLFHIEPGEGRVLAALFALAGTIGFARVLVQTASSTIFLATYDIAILPWVYIGSALAVPVTGYLYKAIEKRTSFERLQTLNLGAQVFVIAALWLSLTLTTSSVPALVLLVWYEVLWSMTTIGLFSTIVRLLNLRQAKRLLGLIGAGDVIAATLGGFLAAPWAQTLGTVSMLLGSAVALVIGMALVSRIVRTFPAASEDVDSNASARGDAGEARSIKLYSRMIFVLVLVSGAAFYFIDNIFYTQAERQFTDEATLAGFLGIFWAMVNLATLGLNLFVAGPLFSRFGVRAALVLLPLLTCALALALTITHVVPAAIGAVFAIAAAINFADWLFRETIWRSSLLILYQPLPAAQRSQLQNRIESVAQSAAQGIAGVVLLGLTALGVTDVGVDMVLMLMLVTATVISIWVGRQYVPMLVNALTKRRLGNGITLPDRASLDLLRTALSGQHPGSVIYALNTLESMAVPWAQLPWQTLLNHPSTVVREDVLRRPSLRTLPDALTVIREKAQHDDAPTVRATALAAWAQLARAGALSYAAAQMDDASSIIRQAALALLLSDEASASAQTTRAEIARLLTSVHPDDRALLASSLAQAQSAECRAALDALLHDPDISVRRQALMSAATSAHDDVWPTLVAALDHRQTAQTAARALSSMGTACLPVLTHTLDQASTQRATRVRIVRVLGKIKDEQSIDVLRREINSHEGAVRNAAWSALRAQDYRWPVADASTWTGHVSRELETCTGTLAALSELGELGELGNMKDELNALAPLRRELEAQFEHSQQCIFLMLACMHDPATIARIQHGMRSQTQAQRVFALEALDSLLSHELRAWLLALLDDDSHDHKLTRLAAIFPQEKMSWPNRAGLLWRTMSQQNHWVRACIWRTLDPSTQQTLLVQEEESKTMLLLIERVLTLKEVSIFAKTPDQTLAELAALLEEKYVAQGEVLFEKGDYGDSLYIIHEGKLRIHAGDHFLNFLGKGDIVGEMAALDASPRSASATAEESSLLLRLDQEALYELMSDHVDVARGIIVVLSRRLRERMKMAALTHGDE